MIKHLAKKTVSTLWTIVTLAAATFLLCGSLSSCQTQTEEPAGSDSPSSDTEPAIVSSGPSEPETSPEALDVSSTPQETDPGDTTAAPEADRTSAPKASPASDTAAAPEADRTPAPKTSPAAPASTEKPGGNSAPSSSAMAAYQEVLQGRARFATADTGSSLDMDHITAAVTSSTDITAQVARFAAVDLDGDGTHEVILWLSAGMNSDFALVILRYQNGTVYSYTEYSRTFGQLKADGTFSYSGSASDHGIGQVRFEKKTGAADTWVTVPIAEQKASDDASIHYSVNGADTTEAEFQRVWDAQNSKADATWYEFTQGNITTVLS